MLVANEKIWEKHVSFIFVTFQARESDSAREFSREVDLASWNARVLESNRKLELAEKENKHYKDEVSLYMKLFNLYIEHTGLRCF